MNYMEKDKQFKDKVLLTYTSPKSTVTMVQMETGIAATSTTVSPTNSGNQVQEQYDLQEQDRGFDW
ncbi:hypothetical protein GCM10017764_19790 [Sphingobacterium griseoflavum]|uniref:Uncharacterized protein n=2 Tax=Sphingobacterium griseoflavum TaxID=1474952 RepID=A0ABQ3HUR9_9SPHI|nr:hypothetical protein GCM10017764_19790 [Sphingobacterium griseoflavum]